jgi:hypothetical protein
MCPHESSGFKKDFVVLALLDIAKSFGADQNRVKLILNL